MDRETENLKETMTASTQVYSGRLLHVFKDDIILPNGRKSTRELIRHNGAVAVVPLLDNGNVIAEHQFRYPFDKVIVEIPAGKLDSPDEDHLEAAKRELRRRQDMRPTNGLRSESSILRLLIRRRLSGSILRGASEKASVTSTRTNFSTSLKSRFLSSSTWS